MSNEMSRRSFIVSSSATAGLVALMAACGKSSSPGTAAASSSATALPRTKLTTLRTAWTYQDVPFDPATFYGGPGFSAMGGMYEGLVQYEAGGVNIIPQLAKSWTISPDGKTYTFKLRSGVKFHDGTPVNAAAFKYSFQRFIDLKGSPSYMLAAVTNLSAPDPETFVITLKTVVQPFMDFLASYVGPKVLSPTTVTKNAGKDHGSTYLKNHDAGSGPYRMTAAPTAGGYTLQAFDGYWGTPPIIDNIDISIITNLTTQVLELKRGNLDLVTFTLPATLATELTSDSDIDIVTYKTILKSMMWVQTTGYFGELPARQALNAAINRQIIATSAYGVGATASDNIYPSSMAGGEVDTQPYKLDPSLLSQYVKAHPAPPVTIGYMQGVDTDSLAAQLVQTELQAAGIKATVRPYATSEVYSFVANPKTVPTLFILSINSDAASPANFLDAYIATGGPATINGASVPAGTRRSQPDRLQRATTKRPPTMSTPRALTPSRTTSSRSPISRRFSTLGRPLAR